MTDNMPDEIWATESKYPTPRIWRDVDIIEGATRYIRADIHEKRVQELLEASNTYVFRVVDVHCDCGRTIRVSHDKEKQDAPE